MKLKFIQVNVYRGMYLKNLVQFLKEQDADIITMQEVTRGAASNHDDKGLDLFDHIKMTLGLNGVFHNDVKIVSDPTALHGNAVLTKFIILESDQIVLRTNREYTEKEFVDPKFFPEFPRSIVDAAVDIDGKLVHVMSLHGAWTAPPDDTPETLRQADLIANHLRSLNAPFIVGADMNTTPDKKVIKIIEEVAQNFMTNSGILRTTHPKVHKVAEKPLLIDYVFASKGFKRLSVSAPEVLASDHLPVIAEVELV